MVELSSDSKTQWPWLWPDASGLPFIVRNLSMSNSCPSRPMRR